MSVRIAFKQVFKGLFLLSSVGSAFAGTLPNGASSINESYQNWHLICQNTKSGVKCNILQEILEGQTHQLFFRIEFKPAESQTHGVMIAPFGLNLTDGITIATEGESVGDVYPFNTCLPVGCLAPLDLDEGQFSSFLKSKKVKVSFTTLKGKLLKFQLPISGLDEALNRARVLTK
ncbi:hypothetical protein GT348_00645 [Aristophania vespae]|uniref:Invasion associated locus B family protein n=1 Tax=Aristophania vespae TaxID=2697033 RepID=A0A6P1NBW3_9PROT|nr:invasion associated locus B family protein [Aristophania vespae]QHI95018.1 hypothetical protein GT348_00645 [Aristophania vespae]UMM64193.1 hypothetical protein DM15PD_11940 [Aristophania vespae]